MVRRRRSKGGNRNIAMSMDDEKTPRRSSISVQYLIAAATAKLHFNEAAAHLKAEHYSQALNSYKEALELNSKNKEALVARSKCYILLGQPDLALNDAETALNLHRNYIPALYQKAESLYHLGHFEHSLMYYHRGLRLRPQLKKFRLGIQKAQEAIVNTIGPTVKIGEDYMKSLSTSTFCNSAKSSQKFKSVSQSSESRAKSAEPNNGSNKQLLGPLSTDEKYLEKLVNHSSLKFLDKKRHGVIINAQEALNYLHTRKKFWDQQAPPIKIKY